MTGPLHVLLVDDDHWVCDTVQRLILNSFPDARFTVAHNGEEGLRVFEAQGADLIISNNRMPLMDGPEMIAAIRASGKETPIISISSAPMARVNALEAGANVFLDKSHLKEIAPTILTLLQLRLPDEDGHGAADVTSSAPKAS